jgi:polar amino acid transport system substrate-binding protein
VNRRRHLLTVALLFTALAVVAARAPSAAQDKDKPLAGKSLVWGGDANGGIPYVLQDPKPAPGRKTRPGENLDVIGFEADLRDALEKELGCTISFRQLKFDNWAEELQQNNCDFFMNGLEIIPDNVQQGDFTKPYYLYQQQFVIRADEKDFSTLEQCRDKGFKVGTLSGSAAERLLKKELKFDPESVKGYEGQEEPYQLLAENREIRGVLMDLPIAIYYATPYSHLKYGKQRKDLKFSGPPFGEGTYGIAVKKGNTALLAQLNGALDALREKGELKRILSKWDLWNVDQYKIYDLPASAAGTEAEPWTFDRYFPLLLDGASVTVQLTVLSFLLAILIGLPVALCRLYGPWPLRVLATLYVEFFRGIPVLLLLYFIYYGLGRFAYDYGLDFLKLDPFLAAVLGFGLNYAAYEAEIYRAGISSIPVGQWEAAASLGMPAPLTFRRIILPQAVRILLPPMTNDFVALFKDTSVVSVIAVVELSTRYQLLIKSGGGYVQIGLVTAVLYLIMSVPLGYLSRYLESRWIVKNA